MGTNKGENLPSNYIAPNHCAATEKAAMYNIGHLGLSLARQLYDRVKKTNSIQPPHLEEVLLVPGPSHRDLLHGTRRR